MAKDKYDSHHFHDNLKGCLLKEIKILNGNNFKDTWGNIIENYTVKLKCHKHNIILCRCGWEFGWHEGMKLTFIKKSKKPVYEITRA